MRLSSDGFAVSGRSLHREQRRSILRGANHEVFRLREVLRVESPDHVVIAKAQELEAILLSLNGDFADIVTYPPRNYCGIVTPQMRNHAEILPHLMARLAAYLKLNSRMDAYRGKLVVVEVGRIRVRA